MTSKSKAPKSKPNAQAQPKQQPQIDPLIQDLLSRLPKSGDVWPEADRIRWLQLLEGSFKRIYKDKTEVA
jgi:hypothetical protein